MSFHHYVSKSFIKHWQPSFDSKLANADKSNGGVFVHDVASKKTEHETNLTTMFSEEHLNEKEVEDKISKFIERYLGNLEDIKPEPGEFKLSDVKWQKYRALVLLTLLQPSRLPGEGKPLINEVLKMDENQIDHLANEYGKKRDFVGIQMPENIFMYLNELGFFVIPSFNFQQREKVLKANEASDLWGVVVPIRPNFCIVSISKEFSDLGWIHKNMHIFQTYSVGLKCQKMIVPPRLKDGGEMHSHGKIKKVTVEECIEDFQRTVKAADDLVKGWFDLRSLEAQFYEKLSSYLKVT